MKSFQQFTEAANLQQVFIELQTKIKSLNSPVLAIRAIRDSVNEHRILLDDNYFEAIAKQIREMWKGQLDGDKKMINAVIIDIWAGLSPTGYGKSNRSHSSYSLIDFAHTLFVTQPPEFFIVEFAKMAKDAYLSGASELMGYPISSVRVISQRYYTKIYEYDAMSKLAELKSILGYGYPNLLTQESGRLMEALGWYDDRVDPQSYGYTVREAIRTMKVQTVPAVFYWETLVDEAMLEELLDRRLGSLLDQCNFSYEENTAVMGKMIRYSIQTKTVADHYVEYFINLSLIRRVIWLKTNESNYLKQPKLFMDFYTAIFENIVLKNAKAQTESTGGYENGDLTGPLKNFLKAFAEMELEPPDSIIEACLMVPETTIAMINDWKITGKTRNILIDRLEQSIEKFSTARRARILQRRINDIDEGANTYEGGVIALLRKYLPYIKIEKSGDVEDGFLNWVSLKVLRQHGEISYEKTPDIIKWLFDGYVAIGDQFEQYGNPEKYYKIYGADFMEGVKLSVDAANYILSSFVVDDKKFVNWKKVLKTNIVGRDQVMSWLRNLEPLYNSDNVNDGEGVKSRKAEMLKEILELLKTNHPDEYFNFVMERTSDNELKQKLADSMTDEQLKTYVIAVLRQGRDYFRKFDYIQLGKLKSITEELLNSSDSSVTYLKDTMKSMQPLYFVPRKKAEVYNRYYNGIFLHATGNLKKTLQTFSSDSTAELCVSTIRTNSIFRSPSLDKTNVILIGFAEIKMLFDFDAYTERTSGGQRVATKSVDTELDEPDEHEQSIADKWYEYAKMLGKEPNFNEKLYMDEGIMDVQDVDEVLLAVIADNPANASERQIGSYDEDGNWHKVHFIDYYTKALKEFNPYIKVITNSQYEKLHSSNQLMNYLIRLKEHNDLEREKADEKHHNYDDMYDESMSFKDFVLKESKMNIDLAAAYELFSQDYIKATGKTWSQDKFFSRAANWEFWGDENGYVAVRPQKSGFYKLVGMAGSDKSKYKGFKELISMGVPLWGMVSKNIADMAGKMGMRVPNWMERTIMKKMIGSSVFGDAKIIEYTNDGGITFEYPDIGQTTKYFIGTQAYYQKAKQMFKSQIKDKMTSFDK